MRAYTGGMCRSNKRTDDRQGNDSGDERYARSRAPRRTDTIHSPVDDRGRRVH
jgi:hypothetical protein